jgi:hypothetical protein
MITALFVGYVLLVIAVFWLYRRFKRHDSDFKSRAWRFHKMSQKRLQR